ncbi:hypothetical protein [Phycisphaera mikurensis]|uniref:Uncharacterized protein n=1 Tax=Phycisphaera mikurensis (strain NBRC 102666 / KCTC 22515 / FYK2301M01) TaxID=1142394 RepID=I0IB98_PHYMF|nr:hypothetical protein [Phycisphaera mikurensis]MBB6443031.1 hypothetical protein [Phycisphaera mikurensis]BAM02536.1 hypothetical protein PSMK_03770 [Phycisphaera mikurensis NBRC 102666]
MATDLRSASPVAAPPQRDAALDASPPAPDRAREMGVTAAAHALAVRLGERGVVQSRGPVGPLDRVDVAVLVPRSDRYLGLTAGPAGDRVLLALAVAPADGTGVPLRPLGAAGIEELWIVDRSTNSLQVHRGGDPTGFAETRFVGPDEPVSPMAFPDLVFFGRDLLS